MQKRSCKVIQKQLKRWSINRSKDHSFTQSFTNQPISSWAKIEGHKTEVMSITLTSRSFSYLLRETQERHFMQNQLKRPQWLLFWRSGNRLIRARLILVGHGQEDGSSLHHVSRTDDRCRRSSMGMLLYYGSSSSDRSVVSRLRSTQWWKRFRCVRRTFERNQVWAKTVKNR